METIKVKVIQRDTKNRFEKDCQSFVNTPNIEIIDFNFSPILHDQKRVRYLAIAMYKVKRPSDNSDE